MKNITMKITIDEAAHTVTLRRAGCKLDESRIYSDKPEAVASIWLDLAAYAMQEAFILEHCADFAPPAYTGKERREMALRICETHKSAFE